jgi:hypothetical protein
VCILLPVKRPASSRSAFHRWSERDWPQQLKDARYNFIVTTSFMYGLFPNSKLEFVYSLILSIEISYEHFDAIIDWIDTLHLLKGKLSVVTFMFRCSIQIQNTTTTSSWYFGLQVLPQFTKHSILFCWYYSLIYMNHVPKSWSWRNSVPPLSHPISCTPSKSIPNVPMFHFS